MTFSVIIFPFHINVPIYFNLEMEYYTNDDI